MANPFLGAILGSVLGQAMGRGGQGGGLGGGGLGGMLGGMLGGGLGGTSMGRSGRGRGGLGGLGGGRTALLAMLLPLAMQWVQRNGGIGNVMQRIGQKGYGRHADSWVGTGQNELMPLQAVDDVVGRDELSRMSQQLGVGEEEVADGFAEILPEMVDQLSPEGRMHERADDALDAGQSTLQRLLEEQRQPAG